MTVIAAGFEGGAPQVRKDGRGLGQVESAAPAIDRPATRRQEPATTTGMHSQARPMVPVEESERYQPVVPASDPYASSAQETVEPNVYQPVQPTPATGQLEVPRIFDEEPPRRRADDLDIPDFLK